jgi:hypothetical protein
MPYVAIPSRRAVQPLGRVTLSPEARAECSAIVCGSRPRELASGTLVTPSAGAPRLQRGSMGIGFGVIDEPDKWETGTFNVGGNSLNGILPTVSNTVFTLEALITMTAAAELSHIFGVRATSANSFPGAQTNGTLRNLIAYPGAPGNIYFWGAGADLDSGVDWGTSNEPQHVFVTAGGGTMTFYRNGAQIAQGSTPGGLIAFSQGQLFIGAKHGSGTVPPVMTLYKGALRNRTYTAAEVKEKTQYPWSDFLVERDRRYFFGVSAAGGGFQPAWAAASNVVIQPGALAA